MREENLSLINRHELQISMSPETPVYDALGIRVIHQVALDFLTHSPEGVDRTATIFIVGPVNAGKEVIADSIFWRNENDADIKGKFDEVKRVTGEEIRVQYLSTPMCNAEGMRRGEINHPIGNFFLKDVLVSDQIMSEKSSEKAQGPTLRVVETVLFGYPNLPFGVKAFLEAIKREKTDSTFKLLVAFVVPSKELQEMAMQDRETIARSQTIEEVKKRLEGRKMSLDVSDDPAQITRSWGNRIAMERVNQAGNEDLIRNQNVLRKAYINFPKAKLSKPYLDSHPRVWQRAHVYRAKHLLGVKFGMKLSDFVVIENNVLSPDKIPTWRSLGKKYAMMDMTAPVSLAA